MNVFLVSLNIGMLGIFYTMLGGLVSYVIYYLFEDHSKKWEESSLAYQLFDIFTEITIIGVTAFWITYWIKNYPPLVPMSKQMDSMIDTYTSSLFFTFSMFLFLNDLSTKIRFVYEKLLKRDFERIFPDGSIFDFFSRKMDDSKSIDKIHQDGVSTFFDN